jgi:hypothetical protein
LQGELARRREDERTGVTAVGLHHQPLEQRQHERRRFSRPRLRDADQVAPREEVRDRGGLDGGGLGVAEVGDGLEKLRAEPECRK